MSFLFCGFKNKSIVHVFTFERIFPVNDHSPRSFCKNNSRGLSLIRRILHRKYPCCLFNWSQCRRIRSKNNFNSKLKLILRVHYYNFEHVLLNVCVLNKIKVTLTLLGAQALLFTVRRLCTDCESIHNRYIL